MISRDSVAGSVYGLALGDTLGRDTEFMSLKKIYKRYGRTGHMPLPLPLKFTDDTQMTIALAKAINDARSLTPRALTRTITDRFIEWKTCDESRAPGVSCMTSITNLTRARRNKRSWITAPVISRGCGANMRVLPAALLPDLDDVLRVTRLQAALTHAHPVAIAATELTALAMRWATIGVDIIELPRMLLERARINTTRNTYDHEWLGKLAHRRWHIGGDSAMVIAWEIMIDKLQNLIDVITYDNVHDVCKLLGEGWIADEALVLGLYFAVKYTHDPYLAISMAARTAGDSDSIACIAGAIVGGHAGVNAWPSNGVARMERHNELNLVIESIVRRWKY